MFVYIATITNTVDTVRCTVIVYARYDCVTACATLLSASSTVFIKYILAYRQQHKVSDAHNNN